MKRKFIKYKKILIFLSAVNLIVYLNLVTPGGIFSFFIFYTFLLLFLFLNFSLLTDIRRNLLYSGAVILFLFLRQIRQLDFINFLIILAFIIIFETGIRKNKK